MELQQALEIIKSCRGRADTAHDGRNRLIAGLITDDPRFNDEVAEVAGINTDLEFGEAVLKKTDDKGKVWWAIVGEKNLSYLAHAGVRFAGSSQYVDGVKGR